MQKYNLKKYRLIVCGTRLVYNNKLFFAWLNIFTFYSFKHIL